MKVVVNIPLKPSREYIGDYEEASIPNVGDDFGDMYVVAEKTVDGDICTLDVQRKTDCSIKLKEKCSNKCAKCICRNCDERFYCDGGNPVFGCGK